ncbi:MAG TPA: tyrosine-type recombinase/integrase [Bacteroidia bacterium]|nr:tyrosine-type recombinase/integrase [Bacteroidia bacterium]
MTTDFPGFLNKKRLSVSSKKTYVAIVRKIQSENPELDKYQYRDIIGLMGKIQRNFSGTAFPGTSLAALKHYFNFLVEEGFREDHPCITMRLRSNVSREIIPTDLFSMTELHLLLKRTERYKELELRNKILISLLIYQAATPGEIVKSLWDDIDLDSETIFLRGTRSISRRRIKLLSNQLDWLDEYGIERSSYENKTNLLLGKLGNGVTPDDIQYLISTACHLFPDRKLTAQTIRQSVIAFWLNEKKIPLEQVQLLAGHKWISSTQRYHFPDFESDKKILRKLHPLG